MNAHDSSALYSALTKEAAEQFLKSIDPDERKNVILAVDENHRTALHVNASLGKTDLVRYLCNIDEVGHELIFKKDKAGKTALHVAKDRATAKVIVDSLDSSKQVGYVLDVDEEHGTILHMTSRDGRSDVMSYIKTLQIPEDKLLFQKDNDGRTALHYAHSKDIAEILVEWVEPVTRRNFILTADENKWTVFHTLAILGNAEVIEYLCDVLSVPDEELVLQRKDYFDRTALHYAKNREIAELLVETVEPEKQRDLIVAVDFNHRTALHVAADLGKTDVVEYLCSIPLQNNDLVHVRDNLGATALHFAKNGEIAEILVECVDFERQREFLMTVKRNQCTALHSAAQFSKTAVVEYLCSIPLPNCELMLKQDADGDTAIHSAGTAEIVEAFIEAMDSESLHNLLLVKNANGENVVLSLVRCGRAESLSCLLENIDEKFSSEYLKAVLQDTNNFGQNILHLASLLLSLDDLYDVLLDYLPDIDSAKMMFPDKYNNTPLHYVAAKYDAKVFADFMLRLSLYERRRVIKSKNMQNTNCETILQQRMFLEDFYIQRVLCETQVKSFSKIFASQGHFASPDLSDQLENPNRYYEYNEDILKVLKYALNEYSLLDSAYTTSHMLFTAAAFPQTLEEGEGSKPDSLYFLIDLEEVPAPKEEKLQAMLNGMDSVEHQGKPKIVVVECSVDATNLNLVVPGPDFLILIVNFLVPHYKTKQKIDINGYDSIEDFINALRCDADVQRVSINSTFNKKYQREEKALNISEREDKNSSRPELTTSIPLVIAGKQRGKALIVCNQLGFKEGMNSKDLLTAESREKTLRNAQMVLGTLLGLQVQVKSNLTGEGIKNAITEFAQSDGHGSIVALAIFSHGNRTISGMNKTECSVQEVISALNSGNVIGIPKLVFLSFCRGEIRAQYNRAPHSFESSPEFPWLESEVGKNLQPVRLALPGNIKAEEWEYPFPCLEVPVDCYIMFSTLPDSKSKQGKLFEMLVSHLTDLSSAVPRQESRVSATENMDDIRQFNEDPETPASSFQSSSKVELITLLTDVAGILREKTRSTQYANICYAVNAASKGIFFDILPGRELIDVGENYM